MNTEPLRTPDGYSLVLASDVLERDGLGLELYDAAGDLLAEVFREDTTARVTVRISPGVSLDLDVAEWSSLGPGKSFSKRP